MVKNSQQNRLYAALQAARLGRDILLSLSGKLKQIEKKHLAGWVSEADKKSEVAIFDFLRKLYPQDEMLGEESAASDAVMSPSEEGRWILDPLDGTTNYLHGFPIYAVSLAYEYRGEVQVAVVDVPALGEVYSAVRGGGAFCNGRPLRVSSTENLSEALLATGFFAEVPEQLELQLQCFSRLVREVRGVRRAGAAAYDLCLVARGVFDAYWERGLSPWDSAAGLLLVQEAGGIITNDRNEKFNPYMNSLVAGNPKIHSQILPFITPGII